MNLFTLPFSACWSSGLLSPCTQNKDEFVDVGRPLAALSTYLPESQVTYSEQPHHALVVLALSEVSVNSGMSTSQLYRKPSSSCSTSRFFTATQSPQPSTKEKLPEARHDLFQPPNMRTSLLTPFLTLLAAATAAATAAGPTTTTTVTLFVPPSQALPNPRALPPSTHATLTSRGAAAAAYLTPSNTFLFRNVSEGSYLLDVHCGTHAFAPLRVDVLPLVAGDTNNDNNGEETAPASLTVKAWETYRGNDWDNKGEALGGGVKFEVRVLGAKAFFAERSSCECLGEENPGWCEEMLTEWPVNILSILKNPMILLGMVSMAIFVGMPYLVDNSKHHFMGPAWRHITDALWKQWIPRCARSGKKARRVTQ